MAKSRRNVITHGLSGLIGDLLVFRQRAGKTIVGDKPAPSSKPPTADMLKSRSRFRRAAIYAKSAIMDVVKKAAYAAVAKRGQTAFNVAFADYQKGPEIETNLDFSFYSGAVGQKLSASVIDNFMVKSVNFSILDTAGEVVESGEAVQADDGLDWVYTTTVSHSDYEGGKVVIKAYDEPGNETLLEVSI